MNPNGPLQQRTKTFALRVLRLCRALPKSADGRILAGQLIRSGTSVGANYRSACRARSRAEFLAKLGIVEEEADESCFWLELIMEDAMLPAKRIQPLWQEAQEILAMVVASRQTSRGR
ncbi:MAG: four helix bundle protein [Phycisphaeraceae bacterium]|nr:four helix bundle protein [Phycisphaeraceae bacterium]